jgi:uncharacterized membrane protein YfcA
MLVPVGLFCNGSGAITLGFRGRGIRRDWVPVLIVGRLPGGYAGAHVPVVKGNRWVKRGFEAVTLPAGHKLIAGRGGPQRSNASNRPFIPVSRSFAGTGQGRGAVEPSD